jgi:fluoride ion exporter CrcB/FEX
MKASMTSALVAAAYVLISLVMGYVAVIIGMKIGGMRVEGSPHS